MEGRMFNGRSGWHWTAAAAGLVGLSVGTVALSPIVVEFELMATTARD